VYSELGCSCINLWYMKFFHKRGFILSPLHVVLIYHFSSDFKNRDPSVRSVSRLPTGRSAFESGRRKQICLPSKIYRIF